MHGQWVGRYSGTNTGLIIVDIDDSDNCYQGSVILFDENPDLPNTLAYVSTESKNTIGSFKTTLNFLHPRTNFIVSPSEIAREFPDVTMPNFAATNYNFINNELHLAWTTNIGTSGNCILVASRSECPSDYTPMEAINTWDDFKDFISSQDTDRYIFRGQWHNKRLRTSFHRSKRSDIIKYGMKDIPILHKYLSGRTSHLYNLQNPQEHGAFWSLVQHHGYPTPLLDWTGSPYIAAYFAFRNKENDEDGRVRIFIFDKEAWLNDFNQIERAWLEQPHFSIIDFYAIGNERSLPQQSVLSLTNIDDIESYIGAKEALTKKTYLRVFDLDRCERSKVLKELSMMGITEASLFPGIDGTCKELRFRNFGE